MKIDDAYFYSDQFLFAFKSGDQIAFKHFFHKTIVLVNHLLWRKYSMRMEYHEREDCIAFAYCKIYDRRKTFREYEHIVASLKQASCHIAIDYLKKRENRKRIEKSWARTTECYGWSDPAQEPPPNMDQLPEVIGKLYPQERTVFELSFFKSKTISEISEMLGICRQTVRNHRTLAISKIRKFLLVKDYRATHKHIC